MQKVVGSSPIIRSQDPQSSGGRATDGSDAHPKPRPASPQSIDAVSDERHFGLDAPQVRVEPEEVVPLVNAESEEQAKDDRRHHTGSDCEDPREQ